MITTGAAQAWSAHCPGASARSRRAHRAPDGDEQLARCERHVEPGGPLAHDDPGDGVDDVERRRPRARVPGLDELAQQLDLGGKSLPQRRLRLPREVVVARFQTRVADWIAGSADRASWSRSSRAAARHGGVPPWPRPPPWRRRVGNAGEGRHPSAPGRDRSPRGAARGARASARHCSTGRRTDRLRFASAVAIASATVLRPNQVQSHDDRRKPLATETTPSPA